MNSLFILGSIQMQAMAILITYMDNGNGLLDRMLFSVPCPLRPTPQERNDAKAELERNPFNVKEIYSKILEKQDKHSEEVQRYVLFFLI